MTRNQLIALAGCTAIALAAPLAAQSTDQGSAGPAPAAQPPAATTSAVAPASADDPNAQPSDAKANPKAKAKPAGETVVKAGPNAGQVIGKAKRSKGDVDAPKSDESSATAKCANPPCG